MSLLQGRYEPETIAGRGAQGYVVRARDHRHDRTVAVKVRRAADPTRRDAMLQETRVLLDLDPHPSLPLVREDFFDGDRYCIVMDWIEGPSLAELLMAQGTQGVDGQLVLEALRQVAAALDHLHDHDPTILHLDVKPGNIIRRSDGRIVLVDLGLAGSELTASPYAEGTPAYRAPELALGGRIGPGADVFSLAVTAFELLSGALPVPGVAPTFGSISDAWAGRIRDALARGLSTDPGHRPRRATELVDLLHAPETPGNLPAALSSFIGRNGELGDVKSLLRRTRCLTITGTGGIGKTRLALEAARESKPAFPDGVWFVDLGGLDDIVDLAEPVAVSLGARVEASSSPLDALTTALETGSQLLVLDNCEHLLEASAVLVEELLRACSMLTVLATSRERLRCGGETVWLTPPLDLPEPGASPEASASVRLFRERAAPALPDGPLGPERSSMVATLCRRLEGIPLAIELAAARLQDLSLDEVVEGVEASLDLLEGGPRTLPRQETVRATIDWSVRSLDDAEAALFAELSVFAGSFSTEAVASVCSSDATPAPGPLLRSLVDRSLCFAARERYRLLGTVRQYATERLDGSHRAGEIRRRHREWFCSLVDEAKANLRGPDQARALGRIDLDLDNVRAALASCLADDREAGLALAVAMESYWTPRGLWTEARGWLEALTSDAPDSTVLAVAVSTAAGFARLQGDYASAVDLAERSLALHRSFGNRLGVANAQLFVAAVCVVSGDHERGRAYTEEALDVFREAGHRRGTAMALGNLGLFAERAGDLATARGCLEEVLTIFAELGDHHQVAISQDNLGVVMCRTGDFETARGLFEQSLSACRELGDRQGSSYALCHLGQLDHIERRRAAARDRYEESLSLRRELGNRPAAAHCLVLLGDLARLEGDHGEAARSFCEALDTQGDAGDPTYCAMALERLAAILPPGEESAELIGCAQGLRAGTSQPFDLIEHHLPVTDAVVAELGDRLGAEGLERALTRGRSMTLERAIGSVTASVGSPLPE